MLISSKQALDLELKLNKTEYATKWCNLGNILYEWRLDPRLYALKCERSYTITNEQFNWIYKNLITDKDENRLFELIIGS